MASDHAYMPLVKPKQWICHYICSHKSISKHCTITCSKCLSASKAMQAFHLYKRSLYSEKALRLRPSMIGSALSPFQSQLPLHSKAYDLWNPCLNCRIIHHDPNPHGDFERRICGAYLLPPECRSADVGASKPTYQTTINRAHWTG